MLINPVLIDPTTDNLKEALINLGVTPAEAARRVDSFSAVIKVMMPTGAHKADPMALAFNQNKALIVTLMITPELRERMNGRDVAYFRSTLGGHDGVILGEDVGNKEW